MHQPQAITTTARALREQGLLRRIHENGDLCARGQLAEKMLPLARALAGRYANRGEPLDDLLQVACIGIMKAIDLFDIGREVRFSSYATPTVLGELKRHFRDNTWAMHVPRGLQELQLKVVKARDKLTHELGRSPSIQEIATAVEAPLEEVLATIQSFSARRTRSLDEPTGEDVTLADSLGMVDPEIERAEMRALLDGAFDVLSDCDQEVLRLRFEHDLTQTEIADRIGVSQMQVSRLIRQSLARMRRNIESSREQEANTAVCQTSAGPLVAPIRLPFRDWSAPGSRPEERGLRTSGALAQISISSRCDNPCAGRGDISPAAVGLGMPVGIGRFASQGTE